MTSRQGRVVLVTGASSGIGRACATLLANVGDQVVGTTRRPPEPVQAELRVDLAESTSLSMTQLDVCDEESVNRWVDDVVRDYGRIDVVINCAGFGFGGAVEQTSDAEAFEILNTNFLGVLRVCRAVLPQMRKQRSGILVNISSIGGRIGLPFQGLYSASKFALEGLTEALRMETRAFGIRAVLIEPGDFRTGFTDSRRHVSASTTDEAYADAHRHVLSIVERDERGGASPERIARLVASILPKRSPRVRYTVGAVSQRLAAGLKNVLPSKWFERGLSLYYGVNRPREGQS